MSAEKPSYLVEAKEALLSSLALAISFSYVSVRFRIRMTHDPLEALLTVSVLTFLLGFIREPNRSIERSIVTSILSTIFSSVITALVLVSPLMVFEINVFEAYISLLLGILFWPFTYLFFLIALVFMLLGSLLSTNT